MNACVQAAKANFDPKSGVFDVGEAKSTASAHVSGQKSMIDPDDEDDTLSPELMAMMEGGGATAIMASGGGGGKCSGGRGGGGGVSYA